MNDNTKQTIHMTRNAFEKDILTDLKYNPNISAITLDGNDVPSNKGLYSICISVNNGKNNKITLRIRVEFIAICILYINV